MRGKLSPKVSKKKGASKNQPSSNVVPAAGKKRKKKVVNGDIRQGKITLLFCHFLAEYFFLLYCR